MAKIRDASEEQKGQKRGADRDDVDDERRLVDGEIREAGGPQGPENGGGCWGDEHNAKIEKAIRGFRGLVLRGLPRGVAGPPRVVRLPGPHRIRVMRDHEAQEANEPDLSEPRIELPGLVDAVYRRRENEEAENEGEEIIQHTDVSSNVGINISSIVFIIH